MAPVRTDTGAIEAPDFSSVPCLTDKERASIRSYVGLAKAGRVVSPDSLIDPVDADSIWVGGEVYANKIRRLNTLRSDAVDADLKQSLDDKMIRMQQLCEDSKDSYSSQHTGVDDGFPFRFTSTSLWRRMISFRGGRDHEQQAQADEAVPAAGTAAGIPAPASSAISPVWAPQSTAPAQTAARPGPLSGETAAAEEPESHRSSPVPDTPDYSAQADTSLDAGLVAVGDSDDDVRPDTPRIEAMFSCEDIAMKHNCMYCPSKCPHTFAGNCDGCNCQGEMLPVFSTLHHPRSKGAIGALLCADHKTDFAITDAWPMARRPRS